jgi:mono/diheme cytochrome c family protein
MPREKYGFYGWSVSARARDNWANALGATAMIRRASTLAFVSTAALLAGCQPSQEDLAAEYSGVVRTYCLECHDDAGREAGLSLEGIDLVHVAANADTFEKVARKLRGRQMPPTGGPRPDDETVMGLVAYLEQNLDAAADTGAPNPGPASIHRLNRTEYGNAVRDLLAVDIDAAEFLPADDEGYGFDNIADILRVSPSLLEQYLGASAKLAALAVGDPDVPPLTTVYRAPSDLSQQGHVEGLPLGTRGGVKFRHNFPLDAEYDFNVFLLRNIVGYMTGLEWPHELEIAVDGERVFLAQVGGEADNAMSDANMSAAANEIDARLRTRVFVKAGPHDVTVTFLGHSAAETHEPLELHTRNLDLQDMNGWPVLDYVNLTGPFNAVGPGTTPSRERIFTCQPADAATARVCATEILSNLARRAYRSQPSERDIAQLLEFYDAGAAREGFDAGIESALRVVLTSPKFLFRDEPDPEGVAPGTLYALGDHELASRLAFFLWSSLPDAELLDAADQGKLSEPAVYREQVLRMLKDRRSAALVENFAGQWLFLRNLASARPDTEEFPNFDDNLRQAMRTETELLFDNVLREDRSVVELLTADYTFVNERLARHYGMQGIYGSHFRKVPVAEDSRRGLLGHASILTVTSYPNRTSPVLRGKWVLENVLGTPAPAPPPNVPALEENSAGRAARTLRERLAEHRANPVCATCHDVMDPIGLGLENFDAIGRWRTREAGGAIDASGQLADGKHINGAAELRAAVTADPEQFARVVTGKLMTYALGRGVESYDMPTIRRIVREAKADDYRFSELVIGIVNSAPFRMRRAQEPATPAGTAVAQTAAE